MGTVERIGFWPKPRWRRGASRARQAGNVTYSVRRLTMSQRSCG